MAGKLGVYRDYNVSKYTKFALVGDRYNKD
jgi:hypothetical protein